MPEPIDYFFSTISPFAYLGHRTLQQIANRHDCAIRYRPFSIAGVWEKSGSVPLSQRTPTRQRYRLVELQRIAWQRGINLNLKPKHFPTNPERADLCCAALVLAGLDPGRFAFAAGEAIWTRDLDIADEALLSALLAENDYPAADIVARSRTPEASELRARNTADAVALDAIGAPSYAFRGEIFWGQDRLEMLEAMIASGRAPFRAPTG
jgi:2-hydroxychromene-2-carboxylate isomerase